MLSILGPVLSAERFDDSDQDNRADEGDDETRDIEATHAAVTEEPSEPTAESGPDDTDDDIEQDALLAIRLHDHRGDPTDETSEHDVDEKTHMI